MHQRHIFAIAVVMIASDVAVRSIFNLAWRVGEAIPYGFPLAVFIPCAFDLKCGCGCTPVEILWETNFWRRRSGGAGEPWRDCGCG
jgi:hypothetical protein